MEKTSYYLGIDLDNDNAVISYFQLNMKEPETVSTVAGSEVYQIPLILAKNMGSVSGLSVRRQNVWHFCRERKQYPVCCRQLLREKSFS